MPADFVDILLKLASTFGTSGALAIFGWIYERRANSELQRKLIKLSTAQLQANADIRTAIETIKEVLRGLKNGKD